jgi:hypothetical protein
MKQFETFKAEVLKQKSAIAAFFSQVCHERI